MRVHPYPSVANFISHRIPLFFISFAIKYLGHFFLQLCTPAILTCRRMQLSKPHGRRSFAPTPDDRLKVSRMAFMGMLQTQIATVFGISDKTLRKHFRDELRTAGIEANFRVIQTLFEMATSGKNTAASIFWAKTRCGFRPTDPPPAPPKTFKAALPPSTIVVLNNDGAPRAD